MKRSNSRRHRGQHDDGRKQTRIAIYYPHEESAFSLSGTGRCPLASALPAHERTAKVLRSPCELETGWLSTHSPRSRLRMSGSFAPQAVIPQPLNIGIARLLSQMRRIIADPTDASRSSAALASDPPLDVSVFRRWLSQAVLPASAVLTLQTGFRDYSPWSQRHAPFPGKSITRHSL